MTDRGRVALSVLTILAVALIVWLPTLGWGLPSRDADKYLFGDRRPWTGAEIVALTATTQPTTARGADVDADPILDRSKPVVLNDTDAKRAAIVRRYRLMSGQPDEFIQFKALSEMAGRSGWEKLDPRLYQYGGLWMYPVGGMVRASMLVGLIQSPPPGTPAIEFYLDHPEVFGRFYVVARFYSWCWGLVAAFAIVWIARRITGSIGLSTLAAVAFMLTPVVRTATHEAKPHLAGAALCLCAVIAATRYVETGRRRWAMAAGALCGAAMAMVVSMLLSCVVLPTMVWLRWRAVKRRGLAGAGGERDAASSSRGSIECQPVDAPSSTAITSGCPLTPSLSPYAGEREPSFVRSLVVPLVASLAVAAIVYVATNPFVLINAISRPEILRSNLGNSTAMYGVGPELTLMGFSAIVVALKGASTEFVLGLIAWPALLVSVVKRRAVPQTWSVLAAPMIAVLVMFVALSAGKQVEYARFGIVPLAATVVAIAAAIDLIARQKLRRDVAAFFAVTMIVSLWTSSRRDVAPSLEIPAAIGVAYEPAPWSCPPVNLFNKQVSLVDIRLAEHRAAVEVTLFPDNLASQVIGDWRPERVDWRDNRFSFVRARSE